MTADNSSDSFVYEDPPHSRELRAHLRALMAETVVAPASAEVPEGDGWRAVGTGFAAADGALQARLQQRIARVDATALPHASAIARLGAAAFARGEGVPPERVEPAYLRDNVALTLAQQQALRAKRPG